MGAIAELKEQRTAETPLLLFECALAGGVTERWCTHRVEYEGETYEARVLRHSIFEIRSAPEEGIDAAAKITVVLANADGHFSQLERTVGWKGSRILVKFVFFDLRSGEAISEAKVVFRGVVNAPEEIGEAEFRLTATSTLSLQRIMLPEVRIQRRCPWKFPTTAEQRVEAVSGGSRGEYSPFFRCGYSADMEGGVGNLREGEPYTSCDGTRGQCEERGMFSEDAAGRATRRFGGIEYVPATTLVRSFGEKGRHWSEALENEARYNDFVPLIYGTVWCRPLIVFAKNDGNLTRMEVLIGMGEIEGVVKVLVNDVEIPAGEEGRDMTGTGWYNVVSLGTRNGAFNLEYVDREGRPLGDCYGSMAVMSVVVPNRISDGRSLPKVEALVRGLKLPRYGEDGMYLGHSFTNNPAWVILDILRRCGWELDQLDLASFARTAAYCEERIPALDPSGNQREVPRFQCNLELRRRRSGAEVIRGIRTGSRLYLTYGLQGKLELRCENSLALQQPEKPEGSNSREPLNGGWPAYEFGDGTGGFSGILRRENGEPSIRFWSRSMAESPNRLTVEFQDEFNDYQQDSLSLVDLDDVVRTGQEVSASLPALGLPNVDQAARVVRFYLNKSIEGNFYSEFETSVKGFGLKPGDLITLTYLREGLERQPFRVLKVAPGTNYGRVRITAQIHSDDWYRDDGWGVGLRVGGRSGRWTSSRLPRPLGGVEIDSEGRPQFGVMERFVENSDGGAELVLAVSFQAPSKPALCSTDAPLVSLAAEVLAEGGALAGGQTLYYALSAVDDQGQESGLSFTVRAVIPEGTQTNCVRLVGLYFSPGAVAFHVYRGESPFQLYRIAAEQPLAPEFTDVGMPTEPVLPPDENYDHANFYWRFELHPEVAATVYGRDRIGYVEGQMQPDEYRGMAVRITRGRGAGQERTVVANDGTTLIVSPPWTVTPDSTSRFIVAEASWRLGARASGSPVELVVPARIGTVVHIMGRSANARDEECSAEISPLTRWRLTGADAPFDLGVPSAPVFGVGGKGGGMVELAGVSFPDLSNTRTVYAGTLALHYWDELSSPSTMSLAEELEPEGSYLVVSGGGEGQVGELLQVDDEIVKIEEVLDGGSRFRISRGVHSSPVGTHEAGRPVYRLQTKVNVVAFPKDFFGSRASGSYAFPIYLPDARIASAEFYISNIHGNSETTAICLTNTADQGLRTLSGGQICLQIEGFLGVQTNAAPPFVMQESHSVRDVFAVVREAPTGGPIEIRLRQDQDLYCELRIEEGTYSSNVVSGFGRPPLQAGAQLNLDIVSVGSITPGRDLTVTMRL